MYAGRANVFQKFFGLFSNKLLLDKEMRRKCGCRLNPRVSRVQPLHRLSRSNVTRTKLLLVNVNVAFIVLQQGPNIHPLFTDEDIPTSYDALNNSHQYFGLGGLAARDAACREALSSRLQRGVGWYWVAARSRSDVGARAPFPRLPSDCRAPLCPFLTSPSGGHLVHGEHCWRRPPDRGVRVWVSRVRINVRFPWLRVRGTAGLLRRARQVNEPRPRLQRRRTKARGSHVTAWLRTLSASCHTRGWPCAPQFKRRCRSLQLQGLSVA